MARRTLRERSAAAVMAAAALSAAFATSSVVARDRSGTGASSWTGDPERSPGVSRGARPLEPRTVDLLLQEAEAAYRGGRWSAALDAFKAVLSVDPDSPQGWLRVGNLHHRRGQWLQAASAYRKAADRSEGDKARAGLRLRALLNLASVNLELAGIALSQAESEPGDHGRSADLDDFEQALHQQLQRARQCNGDSSPGASRSAQSPRAPGVPSPTPTTTTSPATPAAAPAAAAAAATTASATGIPDRDPFPERLPAIEYLRGAPQP